MSLEERQKVFSNLRSGCPPPEFWSVSDKNDFIICMSGMGESWSLSLGRRPWCQTLSNAFSTSKKAAAVLSLFFLARLRWSVSLMNWSTVECCLRKANCSLLKCSVDDLNFSWMTFSISLDRNESKVSGRWFEGMLWSLPGFGLMITMPSFQDFGK